MSELKIGDWVIDIKYKKIWKIIEIDQYGFYIANMEFIPNDKFNEFELWQPKEGEFIVRKFGKNAIIMPYTTCEATIGKNPIIEPFIGELPSWIKEN